MEFHHERNRIYAAGPDGALLAEITFPEKEGVAVIDHTFVHESLRGQGVARKLMEEAVAAIEAQGWKVGASCSYAVSWLEKHTRQEKKT